MQGDLGSIPGLEKSPEEGNSHSLQYSGPENSMDYIVHGVAKNRTRLSYFHLLTYYQTSLFYLGFPGGSEVIASAWNAGDLGSIPGLGRSPGEGNGKSLVGYSPWGPKELDTTERFHFHFK